MNVIKVKSHEAVATIQDFIVNKKHGVAYCVHDEKLVFITELNTINEDVCDKEGYTVLDTRHTGGVVVVSEGDMSVVHFGEIGNEFMKNFALYLIERYREKGLDATFDGNDVLVDGYKISGLSATPYGHIQYSTIHVGINTNLDHIKAICKKPMVKVPKGLSEYGITSEEVEKMFLDFCKQDGDE
jgi:lipoate-protein ligase A